MNEAERARLGGRFSSGEHVAGRMARPMARTRCGEIVAATMPSLTSDNTKLAASTATTTSQAATRPDAAAECVTLHTRDDRPRTGMHGERTCAPP